MKLYIVVEIDTHNEDGVWTRNYAGLTHYYSLADAQDALDSLCDDFTDGSIETIEVDMLP
jgi:hypothetical protein